ncbi:V-type proton ATPase subunit G 3 isoform X1 [Alligator mississippiensis]|uniref:V-type proton ATPase subunit G 3 isoform X1 n=1 Tax=Alligator mississippiensis TaxID=8496 RepID=UPI00090761E4|nr:V-type proton ATPase subunit G 3 isoform X1 [Alligator mississippiensis]
MRTGRNLRRPPSPIPCSKQDIFNYIIPAKALSSWVVKTSNDGDSTTFLGKGKRLRQAKEEATAEIDHYRLQREKEFRHKQSNIMGSQGNLSTKIEDQTTEKIQAVTSNYHKEMESMMKKLLNMVYDIKPEIHLNYKATDVSIAV